MTNEEYSKALVSCIEQLQAMRKKAVSIAAGIIGKTLCMDDLFFCASVFNNSIIVLLFRFNHTVCA